MGSAIIAGLRSAGGVPRIRICDPDPAICNRHRAAGLEIAADPLTAITDSPLVLLAVKPQAAQAVLAPLAGAFTAEHLLVSILAGTTCQQLESWLPEGVRVVRAMPNTPMAIGQGMVGIAAGQRAQAEDLDLAEALFTPAARVLRVSEDRLDALTAVSGSGPAYLFAFAEALLAGAGRLGFSSEEATLLVGTTLAGSIAYLQGQDGFPATRLREQVTSPGGTTAAALEVLAQAGFADTVARALAAAAARSVELARS